MNPVHTLISQRTHPALRHLIEPGASLTDDLMMDDLDLLSLRHDLEESVLGQEIPGHVWVKVRTVGELEALVGKVTT